jgi:hypothetical protein
LDNLYFQVFRQDLLISEAKNYLNADRQGDLTQEQMLSEYEGEIHRLLKKTYWSITKTRFFIPMS